MLTAFGKVLRILRIERGELLKDMSEKLYITVAYLSAIENGKRAIPPDFIAKLTALYALNCQEVKRLQDAADQSIAGTHIALDGFDGQKRSLAAAFAREFKDFDEEQLDALRAILAKKSKE